MIFFRVLGSFSEIPLFDDDEKTFFAQMIFLLIRLSYFCVTGSLQDMKSHA